MVQECRKLHIRCSSGWSESSQSGPSSSVTVDGLESFSMRSNSNARHSLMKSVVRVDGRALLLLLSLTALFCNGSSSEMQAQRVLSSAKSKWIVQLKSYGWSAPKLPSNKTFFKDFSLPKLEAQDINTRILFVNDNILVAYHTREEGQDWHTASRQLEAFFINAKDGSLLGVKHWPAVVRGSEHDLIDSESRLIPLADGRFLAFANHAMMLYGSDLELVKQKSLQLSTSTDLWSAQSVDSGHKIFLRQQSLSDQRTTYFWLASDTWLLLSQMSGFQGPNFSVVASAGDNFVLTGIGFSRPGITTGMGKISPDGSSKIICSDPLCSEGNPTVLSSQRIAVSGRHGIGLVDPERGLIWSRQILPSENPNDFQFGEIHSDISGTRFAVWVTAYHKTPFDGVEVSSSPMLFAYDASDPKLLLAVPIERQTGDVDYALSPNGRQVAIFDGARIRLYVID